MMAKAAPKPMRNPISMAIAILDADKSPENWVIILCMYTLLLVVF
jgi:hypothetical protein